MLLIKKCGRGNLSQKERFNVYKSRLKRSEKGRDLILTEGGAPLTRFYLKCCLQPERSSSHRCCSSSCESFRSHEFQAKRGGWRCSQSLRGFLLIGSERALSQQHLISGCVEQQPEQGLCRFLAVWPSTGPVQGSAQNEARREVTHGRRCRSGS